MGHGPRYDPLFEPIRLGSVTAPNRFYQVPRCSGMGYHHPQMLAAMRLCATGAWGNYSESVIAAAAYAGHKAARELGCRQPEVRRDRVIV
jgi:2,4-dienoyl-CoA reductase-like NADH-dependent reductase (Old Yellow Enzyme family)